MLTFIRTSSTNPDFITIVHQLDTELAEIDGAEHAFYAQYNKIDKIDHVILAYENGLPVACGAIKKYDEFTMEVKRMFTNRAYRGSGFASKVLNELEKWAVEINFKSCVLETGKRQPDAIQLYEKNGYTIIPNYGQYAEVENSICFIKNISL